MNAKKLKETLLRDIENETYKCGEKLPTENELMEIYSSTRYSVRKALDELSKSSNVYQVQGSGVFVREFKRSGCMTLTNTKGISSEFPDSKVTTKVISIEEHLATLGDIEVFKCSNTTIIYHVKRIRYIDDIPFSIEYSKYNKDYVTYLNHEIATSSIFEYIQSALQLNIGFGDKIISTRLLTNQEASLLELQENDPAIIINDTVYLKTGEIFDYSTVIYNHNYAKFFTMSVYGK